MNEVREPLNLSNQFMPHNKPGGSLNGMGENANDDLIQGVPVIIQNNDPIIVNDTNLVIGLFIKTSVVTLTNGDVVEARIPNNPYAKRKFLEIKNNHIPLNAEDPTPYVIKVGSNTPARNLLPNESIRFDFKSEKWVSIYMSGNNVSACIMEGY